MRLLLDQMLDAEAAEALRRAGHDVVRVADVGMGRATDGEILQRAIAGDRVLLTLDEHFGDWAVLPLESHTGVVRVKAHPTTSDRILRTVLPFLAQHATRDFSNCLVIVRETGARWIHTRE